MEEATLNEIMSLARKLEGRYADAYVVGMMSAHLCDCAMQSIKESLERQIAHRETNNV